MTEREFKVNEMIISMTIMLIVIVIIIMTMITINESVGDDSRHFYWIHIVGCELHKGVIL